MRYHYEKPSMYVTMYGETYICNHPVYSRCTLFKIEDKGLAVIQQRFDDERKTTYWSEIDPWLSNDLYLNPKFKEFFDARSDTRKSGLYPTVTIRQIMWALKMKPIPRKVGKPSSIVRTCKYAKFARHIMKENQTSKKENEL